MQKKLTLGIFFTLIFIFFIHPFDGNGDFYHHITAGKYILQNGNLPNLDIFTHTANGLPWVAHSWLSGVIFYFIFSISSEAGISLFFAFIALLTFVLAYFLLKTYQIAPKFIILTLSVAIAPISIRWPQRPEVFNYPLLILLFLIYRLKERYRFLPLLIPVLILIWANLYGASVIAGLGVIILLVIHRLIEDRFKLKTAGKIFYFSALASFPISLLNGYGLKTIIYIYFFIPKVAKYEAEWAGIPNLLKNLSPSQLLTYQYQFLIYFICLAAIIILALLSRRRLRNYLFPCILGLGLVIPFFAFRHLPTAVILSLPLTGLLLQHQKKRFVYFWLSLALLTISLALWINPPGLRDYNPSSDLIKFAKENNLSGKSFNHLHIGGLLSYYLYPQVLTFYDTRDELFLETEAFKDLYETYSLGKNIIPLLNKYKIDLVIADFITDGISYKDLFYSPNWAIIYFNDRYFVAVPLQVAKNKGLKTIDSVDPFSKSKAKPGREEAALLYYREIMQKSPKSLTNKLHLASTLLELGKNDQVIDTLSLSLPDSPTKTLLLKDINRLLSEAYLNKKDCINSKKYLQTQDSKARAFYALICEKNLIKARAALDEYLSQANISPLEKLKASDEFERLKAAN